MGRRSRSIRRIAAEYFSAAVGGTATAGAIIALSDRMYGTHPDYWFAPIIGIGLPSAVLFLDSMKNLADEMGIGRRQPTVIDAIQPYQDRDSIPYRAGKRTGNIFRNTFHSIFSQPPPRRHVSPKNSYVSDDAITFVVFTDRRDKPTMIDEKFLLHFLRIAWERQNSTDRSVSERVFSRPYFTSEINLCSHSKYYAMMKLCGPIVWGREQGASGYLSVRPDRAIRVIRSIYFDHWSH